MKIGKQVFAVLAAVMMAASSLHAGDIVGNTCAVCGKVVSDTRFAAVMEEDSKMRYFNDIGCAVKYLKGKCTSESRECDFSMRVFDYDSAEPVHIRAAYYLQSRKIKTPNGSGIVAFKEEKNAAGFLKAKGLQKKVLDFEDLK